MSRSIRGILGLIVSLVAASHGHAGGKPAVGFKDQGKELRVVIGVQLFAANSFGDATVKRPFFYRVHAPNGIQVTRTYPPVMGKDATDHADMHPGTWLAFGDLNGSD